jgi:hypothetical protein
VSATHQKLSIIVVLSLVPTSYFIREVIRSTPESAEWIIGRSLSPNTSATQALNRHQITIFGVYMLIYILAEERSGSTWVTNQLCAQLNRTRAYIENSNDQEVNDQRLAFIRANPAAYSNPNKVYQTHLFPIVELGDCLNEPLFIRTVRRDAMEQLMSYFIAAKKVANFPNFTIEPGSIELTAGDVQAYFHKKQQNENLWENAPIHTKRQTVVYEDLFQGVRIRALNTTLRFEKKPKKADKAKYFANYDQIEEQAFKQGWI